MNRFKKYKVGGCVRDFIMGRESKDIDIVVLAPSYEEMKNEFLESGGKIYQERKEFFTIRGHDPKIGPVDLVLGRKDGEYHNGRHPESVEVCQSIEEELQRRDLILNAIAQDLETGEIIDPFNGRRDIEAQYIQCVGDTETRMREDVIRLLRAFKFATRFDFDVSFNIWEAAREKSIIDLFDNIPKERIYEELKEMFSNNTWEALNIFGRLPLLKNKIFLDKGIKLIPKV